MVAVRHAAKGFALQLEVRLTDHRHLMAVVERIRRMFDLDANPQAIPQVLHMARLAGPLVEHRAYPHMERYFPTADELASVDWGPIGMPAKRKATIGRLSRSIASGALRLDASVGLARFMGALQSVPGIGSWTANTVAMRALGEPDAFPASDLGIVKALQQGPVRPSVRQVAARAEGWRPWRAYAAVYLWQIKESP